MSKAQLERVLATHPKTVTALKAISPEHIHLNIEPIRRCPGKSLLSITYPTVKEEQQIQNILGDDFHGVPYWLQNI